MVGNQSIVEVLIATPLVILHLFQRKVNVALFRV